MISSDPTDNPSCNHSEDSEILWKPSEEGNISEKSNIASTLCSIERETKYPNIVWNSSIEHDVKDIGEKSKGYKIMHIQESIKMTQIYTNLMYTGITLGPLAGLLSGIGSSLNPDAPVIFPIISACVAFISGIVVAVTKYGKFEEKVLHHKTAASKYTGLESNVRRQLVLERKDRVNPVEYLEYIGGNFDELFETSPLVSKYVYNDYVKVAKNNDTIIPEEYELAIHIDETYQEEKFNEMRNFSDIHINRTPLPKESVTNIKNSGKIFEKVSSSMKIKNSNDIKDDRKVKRETSFTVFPELNKYSDGRMEYEMKRMTGLI
jgi:hypothetical protein